MKKRIVTPNPPGFVSNAWVIAVLAVTAFAVNANILYNGFVLDDEAQVQRNPWIQEWGSIPRMFSGNAWSFAGSHSQSNYYRPLMHVIYLVTNKAFGLQPWAFHLVSLLFHVANTLLLYFVASRIFSRPAPVKQAFSSRWNHLLSVPFLAALFFAIHPAHTEAVAWIASIPELSFSAFCLCALLVYAHPELSKASLALSAVLYSMGLLCKETALMFPVLLGVFDLVFRRGETWIERGKRWIPFVVVTAIYLVIRRAAMANSALPALPTETLGLTRYIAYLLPLFSQYVITTLAPIHLHFWHVVRPLSSFLSAEGLFQLSVAGGFAAAVVVAWRRYRPAFFCLMLFIVMLLPAFHITAIAGKPFAERYLYFPSTGFVLLAALLFGKALPKQAMKLTAMVALGVMLVLYAAGTVSHNRVWKDVVTLYLDNARKSPEAPAPCNDLARLLFANGRVEEAIGLFQQEVLHNPSNAGCQSALGSALLMKGRVDEAVTHLEASIKLEPNDLDSLNDLGVAFRRTGRNQDAIAQYRKALVINPDYPDAHFNLGAVLADTGATAEAVEQYRTAVRLRPGDAYYRNSLGIELAKQGLIEEAVGEFEQAIRLAPGEPAYRRNLDHARSLKKQE